MIPAYLPGHRDYIERILYAYSEGIKSGLIILAQGVIDQKELSKEELQKVEEETAELMFEGIHAALTQRKNVIEVLTRAYNKAQEAGDQRESEVLWHRIREMTQVKVFDLLFPSGSLSRISGTGLSDELLGQFERAWMRIPVQEYLVYESDVEALGPRQVDYARDRTWTFIQSQQQ